MRFLCSGLGFVGLCAAVAIAADANEYLTKEGHLTAVLKLQDGQMGFAGTTGTSWTIECDGQWKQCSVFNEKEEPQCSGKLDKKQLEALAAVLTEHKMKKLPDSFGKQVDVNPKVYTLSFGDKKSELTLDGGEELAGAKGVKDAEALKRYAAIVDCVKGMCKEDKK